MNIINNHHMTTIEAMYVNFFSWKRGTAVYEYDKTIHRSDGFFQILDEETVIYNEDIACSVIQADRDHISLFMIYSNKPIKSVSKKLRTALALQEF